MRPAQMFREVVPKLSQDAHVIAPDLLGFGESDVLQSPSFPALGAAISELLDRLSVGPRYIYLAELENYYSGRCRNGGPPFDKK
jgi:pimeloyl-ACP methyl ester carboxylesterase